MISFLINSIGKWKLDRKYAKFSRQPAAINLLYMEKAIVVFNITDEENYQQIFNFSRGLKTKEGFRYLTMVGFNGKKELPSFVDSNQVKVLDTENCSIYGYPNDEFAAPILEEEYDLLIDFTQKSFVPTDYFLALTKAKTKVGITNSENEYLFDLLIELKDNSDIAMYQKETIRYLKMINKDN